jgi:hypothetical protein
MIGQFSKSTWILTQVNGQVIRASIRQLEAVFSRTIPDSKEGSEEYWRRYLVAKGVSLETAAIPETAKSKPANPWQSYLKERAARKG